MENRELAQGGSGCEHVSTEAYEMYVKIARELLEGGTFYAFGSFLK